MALSKWQTAKMAAAKMAGQTAKMAAAKMADCQNGSCQNGRPDCQNGTVKMADCHYGRLPKWQPPSMAATLRSYAGEWSFVSWTPTLGKEVSARQQQTRGDAKHRP